MFALVLILFLTVYCLRICSEWSVRSFCVSGRFAGVRGPGLFFLVPFLETTPYTIDLRTVTSNISAEQTLTRDNVPVNVDTVIYWKVIDPKLAVLEVTDYQQAILGAAQDRIARHHRSQ